MLTYPEAKLLADSLVEAISPYCERVEIAGSVRRKKPVVKDIELVAIARQDLRADPADLFSAQVKTDVLHEDWAIRGSKFRLVKVPAGARWSDVSAVSTWPVEAARVHWIKPGTKNGTPIVPWKVEPFGSYWRGLIWLGEQPTEAVDFNKPEDVLPPHVKLDLFLTSPEKWGVIFTVRTGSAEFSHELMVWAKHQRRTPVERGRIMNYGRPAPTPEERDVFNFLGLEYVEPEGRVGRSAIRPKR